MKKELMKSLFKIFGVLLMCCILVPSLEAQVSKSTSIEKSFSVQSGALIKMVHKQGKIFVKRSKTKNVEVIMSATVTGEYEKDVDAMLKQLDLEDADNTNAQVVVVSNSNMKSWNKINGKSTIKLESGEQLKGIEEMEFDLEIAIPDGVNLDLTNKYDDIEIESIKADVALQNYSGNITAGNIDGDLYLDLKYGQAQIGNVKNADMLLYESKVVMGNAEDLKLDSKYSKHTIGNLQYANIKSYECIFTISKIEGDINIDDKYSEWVVSTFKNGKLKLYESEWKIAKLKNMQLDSKNSELEISSVEVLEIEKSHEDDIDITKLSELKCSKSRFIDIKIDNLEKGIYFYNDYSGDIEVKSVNRKFEKAELQGKSTDMELPLNTTSYVIEVDAKNSDISLDEDKLESGFFSEKRNELTIRGKMNGANNKSPKVILKGYNLDVELD